MCDVLHDLVTQLGFTIVGDLDLTSECAGIAGGSGAVERAFNVHVVDVGWRGIGAGGIAVTIQVDVAVARGGGVAETCGGVVNAPVGACIHVRVDDQVAVDVVPSYFLIDVNGVGVVDGVFTDVHIR